MLLLACEPSLIQYKRSNDRLVEAESFFRCYCDKVLQTCRLFQGRRAPERLSLHDELMYYAYEQVIIYKLL